MQSRSFLQDQLPKIVLAPSFLVIVIFVYGFIAYTGFLSITDSKMLPSYNIVGLSNYSKLWALPHWWRAIANLAIFASLYILICSVLGLFLAIMLDQKIRGEGFLRPIYLYPMALSFIVTGTAWKWILDPGIGIENTMHLWGWETFAFTWIKDSKMAIYCVVLAAVWQSSGFIMAMFLAGLRGVDNEMIKAAQIDGAGTVTIYRRIIIPLMRPVFLSAFVVLAHLAIKAYDLIVALTGGGPGQATELPATFMYSYTFTRNQMGIGASSAIIMLVMIFSIIVPYLYSEIRGGKR
ncbi:carbohydrate ABC transporter membrane protein 1 (CUT1 family) [Rhizobium sp. PP-F2F-G38]|uniref:Sugar ABC transporter permease n=1 Tax=Ferranicluibacter rubi TaxID=2715133 RepID=A0AA43ZGY0_9HYPH|nr:sugar ABC transporter permease [Ferranicluibacter rubi]PYE23993.1 carbohydrate ABC transporter membrane protein 1 (CUT1 family) [Rhizobium sp. PP-CC-3A-592]PYE32183.1 carbohydrate ABC transporter membrane protein 1 (CUT1 family) [Rhizobium sp. PP-WC-1G-195]PYE43503.1 carbohydrate ABC transporter membrane protein 1 (CUT1 family) [Rhizobium sp. PP-F2F-G20b]PYE94877.1 carbohydrate ABC transporter membrane protein 1 (CUT1 family) [Rhizobium sp. PP-F2F-G38]TCL92329.1 carbohydrate ABC transporter